MSFLKIVGRSLLLPLAVLPFGVGMMILGASSTGLNLPLFEFGAALLRYMPLFFAIGLAISDFQAGRGVIVLAVVAGYALVMLAVEGVLAGLSLLADSTFITEQWQTFAIVGGFFLVCYLIIFFIVRWLDPRGSRRRRKRKSSSHRLHPHDAAGSYIYALGGDDNIVKVDNCATRLLVTVHDSSLTDESQLKTLGAKNVVLPSETAVQVTTGRDTEYIASAVRTLLLDENGAHEAAEEITTADQKPETTENGQSPYDPAVSTSVALMIKALGGADNIIDAEDIATTRLRVVVRDESLVDEEKIRAAGASGVMALGNTYHILFGMNAAAYAQEMQLRLDEIQQEH